MNVPRERTKSTGWMPIVSNRFGGAGFFCFFGQSDFLRRMRLAINDGHADFIVPTKEAGRDHPAEVAIGAG